MDRTLVYYAKSPTAKYYVGITRYSLEQRRSEHARAAASGSPYKFHKAVRKYGALLEWGVLGFAESYEAAKNLEKNFITEFDSFRNGYNSTLGGEGNLGCDNRGNKNPFFGRRHSEESRKKMSAKLKGRPGPRRGISHTEETKNLVSASKKAQFKDPSFYQAHLQSHRAVSVEAVSANTGIVIGTWPSITGCARELGIYRRAIDRSLQTGRAQHGFYFMKVA